MGKNLSSRFEPEVEIQNKPDLKTIYINSKGPGIKKICRTGFHRTRLFQIEVGPLTVPLPVEFCAVEYDGCRGARWESDYYFKTHFLTHPVLPAPPVKRWAPARPFSCAAPSPCPQRALMWVQRSYFRIVILKDPVVCITHKEVHNIKNLPAGAFYIYGSSCIVCVLGGCRGHMEGVDWLQLQACLWARVWSGQAEEQGSPAPGVHQYPSQGPATQSKRIGANFPNKLSGD